MELLEFSHQIQSQYGLISLFEDNHYESLKAFILHKDTATEDLMLL